MGHGDRDMFIITIIIALLILIINLLVGCSFYKDNKKYAFCIALALLFSTCYISVGFYLYKGNAFFPMLLMLIASFACAGVFARAKPKMNVKYNEDYTNSIIYKEYDMPVIYIKFIIIAGLFIAFTLYLNSVKASITSKEDVHHISLLKDQCKQMIKQNIVIKNSLNTHDILGTSYYRAPATGNEAITMDFDVKNALGIKVNYSARCLFPVNEAPEIYFIQK